MRIRDEDGSSLIEMMMVLVLLILFGFSMYSLIYEGSSTMQAIEQEKEAEMNARIALSYMNVRIRQNDGREMVRVARNNLNGQESIVLKYRDPLDAWNNYDTWIFWADGELQEVLSDPDAEPDWFGSSEIAAVDSFEPVIDAGGLLTNTITFPYRGATKSMSSSFKLRSWGAAS